MQTIVHMPNGEQAHINFETPPKRGDQIVIPGRKKLVQICNIRHFTEQSGNVLTQTKIEMWTLNV